MKGTEKNLVLQEAYFHMSNSGLTIRMIEKQHYENKKLKWVYHFLEFQNSYFGISNTYRIQIETPDFIDYMIYIFRQLKNRITDSEISDAYFHVTSSQKIVQSLQDQKDGKKRTHCTPEWLDECIKNAQKELENGKLRKNRARDTYKSPDIKIKDGVEVKPKKSKNCKNV